MRWPSMRWPLALVIVIVIAIFLFLFLFLFLARFPFDLFSSHQVLRARAAVSQGRQGEREESWRGRTRHAKQCSSDIRWSSCPRKVS